MSDFMVSLEDYLRQKSIPRLLIDMLLIVVTGGFWVGWLFVRCLEHHRDLNAGEVAA